MKSEALKETGRRHELREEWFQALEAYLRAVDTRPDDEEPDISLHNRIGDLQVRVGDRVGAVESYVQAVDLYMEAGLPNNAIAVCRKIVRTDPALPESYIRMGRIRATQGLLVDARQNFLTYAEMLEARGGTDEALRAIQEFVEMAPGEVDTREFLSGQLVARGRQEEAVRYLSEAYRILKRDGEAERAGAILVRLRELVPDMPAPDEDDQPEPRDAGSPGMLELSGFESTALAETEQGPGGDEPSDSDAALSDDSESESLAPIEEPAPPETPNATRETAAIEPPAGFSEVFGIEEESDAARGTDVAPESDRAPGSDFAIRPEFESEVDRDSELHPGGAGVQGVEDWEDVDSEDVEPEDSVSELPYLDLDAADPQFEDREAQDELEDPDSVVAGDGADILEGSHEGAPGGPGNMEGAEVDERVEPEHGVEAAGDGVEGEKGYVDIGAWVLEGQKERTTRWTVQAEAPTADEDADFQKTLARFRQKVSEHIDSEDATAHYDLGMAYREMGLLDEAIGEFQLALRSSRDSLATIEMLGQCFLDKGQPEIAIHTLERGTRLEGEVDDDFIGIYYFLGHAYEAVGNAASAREFYERVFALDINFRDVTDRLKRLR